MPRKAFTADIKTASESNIPSISSVARGDDDGSVYATFAAEGHLPIEIELMVQPGKLFIRTINSPRQCKHGF